MNEIIQKIARNYSNVMNYKETNSTQMCALIGLIYLGGILKSGRLMMHFRMIMVQDLNLDSLEGRKRTEKLCPIRVLYELFLYNCKNGYTPFEYVTIDEKL